MTENATQARLNREFACRLDELSDQIERMRVLLTHIERGIRETAEQRRTECGVTTCDLDAIR